MLTEYVGFGVCGVSVQLETVEVPMPEATKKPTRADVAIPVM